MALFLTAMRHFADELKRQNYPIAYIQESPLPIVQALKEHILKRGV
ncbi:MAG TPA: hypothetical protein DCW35_05365 [Polynucleobacter sp.]|nr:hypothetical protein [Polynucleobacter sp.]